MTDGITEFSVNGETGDIGDISEGMFVRAKGDVSEDGASVTASQVFASDELPERPAGGQGQRPDPGGRPSRGQ